MLTESDRKAVRPATCGKVSFAILVLLTFLFSENVFAHGAHVAGELGHATQRGNAPGEGGADPHRHGTDPEDNPGDGCCTSVHSHAPMLAASVASPDSPGSSIRKVTERFSGPREVYLDPLTPPPNRA